VALGGRIRAAAMTLIREGVRQGRRYLGLVTVAIGGKLMERRRIAEIDLQGYVRSSLIQDTGSEAAKGSGGSLRIPCFPSHNSTLGDAPSVRFSFFQMFIMLPDKLIDTLLREKSYEFQPPFKRNTEI
jgi:hypothetical protein